jgi:hypothetical protein
VVGTPRWDLDEGTAPDESTLRLRHLLERLLEMEGGQGHVGTT